VDITKLKSTKIKQNYITRVVRVNQRKTYN